MSLDYFPIFVILVIAYLVPMILAWLEVSRIPSVLVEILMGIIIGPHILDLVGETSYMEFLAYTGFLFLIFLSGLEIDIGKIKASFPRGKISVSSLVSNPFLLAVFIYTGSLVISLPVAFLVNLLYGIDIVFFTLLFPTVAISIIVPILKSDGEITRRFGQVILLEGAIATIMSIILISLYAGILQYGFQKELLLFLVIFVTFFVAYKIGSIMTKIPLFQKIQYILEHAASQIRVRGSIALLLLFVVVADLINMELVLGAFFAGVLISIFTAKERSSLLFKLDGMSYGFFIPIFFIMVGVNLDLSVLNNLGSSLLFVSVLLVGFYFIQVMPSLIMGRLFGMKRAVSAGILLTSRLGLAIATAQIGLSLDVISPAANTAIVLAAIITSVLSPLFYKQLTQVGQKHYKLYIIGGGPSGALLAERMKMHGMSYVLIENDHKRLKDLDEQAAELVVGDFKDENLYKEMGLQPQDQVILLTGSDETNQEMIDFFRDKFNHSKIIALDHDEHSAVSTKASEVQHISANEIIAHHFENLIFNPTSEAMLTDAFGTYLVEEIPMMNRNIDGKRVKEIPFHPAGSLMLLRREKEIFVPHGDTHLLMGDLITVIGTRQALETFHKKFG